MGARFHAKHRLSHPPALRLDNDEAARRLELGGQPVGELLDGALDDDGVIRRARRPAFHQLAFHQGNAGNSGKRGAAKGSWLEQMLARKPRMLVTVALANKTARIVWALLVKNEDYRAPVAAAA